MRWFRFGYDLALSLAWWVWERRDGGYPQTLPAAFFWWHSEEREGDSTTPNYPILQGKEEEGMGGWCLRNTGKFYSQRRGCFLGASILCGIGQHNKI